MNDNGSIVPVISAGIIVVPAILFMLYRMAELVGCCQNRTDEALKKWARGREPITFKRNGSANRAT